MSDGLTEGNTKSGNGTVKTGASHMKPKSPPPAGNPKKPKTNERVEQLEKEVAYLNEQLWYTQEAVRRMMLELSNNLGPAGADAVVALMSEWMQIIHNINIDHGKTGSNNGEQTRT